MLKTVSDIMWGPVTPLIFAGVGLLFIIKLSFFSRGMIKYIFKNTVFSLAKSKKSDGLSPFSAMATALGGTIGVGNTVGVASAIISGGYGAVLWMIIASFFGMAIKYAEIYLAVKFKTKNGGGAMYYISKGLKSPALATIFAVVCLFASFGMGNMAQSNAVSQYISQSFNVTGYISGIFCAVITFYMVCGGIKRIGKISAVTVPFMAVIYIIMALGIVIINIRNLPSAVKEIFSCAFDFGSVSGGIGGFLLSDAIRYGFARGLFSNEAGMGSSPTAHAASQESVPSKQAVWGVFEVFADTVAVCGITALAIVCSGVHSCNPAQLVYNMFFSTYGSFGGIFLSISIIFFALASIFCWYIYGQACLDFICKNKFLTVFYRLVFSFAVFLGAVTNIEAVWNISDIFNAIMAFINLISIVLLSDRVAPIPFKDNKGTE